jgi:hypothetical protein
MSTARSTSCAACPARRGRTRHSRTCKRTRAACGSGPCVIAPGGLGRRFLSTVIPSQGRSADRRAGKDSRGFRRTAAGTPGNSEFPRELRQRPLERLRRALALPAITCVWESGLRPQRLPARSGAPHGTSAEVGQCYCRKTMAALAVRLADLEEKLGTWGCANLRKALGFLMATRQARFPPPCSLASDSKAGVETQEPPIGEQPCNEK